MNERDKHFILADVKDYILDQGAIRFLYDLRDHYPAAFKNLQMAFAVDKPATEVPALLKPKHE